MTRPVVMGHTVSGTVQTRAMLHPQAVAIVVDVLGAMASYSRDVSLLPGSRKGISFPNQHRERINLIDVIH